MFWRRVGEQKVRVDPKESNRRNKEALKALIDSGQTPGLLGYVNGKVAGWVAVGPREGFERLERSRKLKRLDDRPVWSVPCFFIAAGFRRKGLMSALLAAAVAFARERGATLIEGYPLDPHGKIPGADGYTGIASAFRHAGFSEVARPGNEQAIMRLEA
jgi:GNAT superfamily N-acetyltransferase